MNKGLFWNWDEPIIPSLLELDVYKLVMLYFIWRFYPNLIVKFAFKNRTTKVKLPEHISIAELKEELSYVEMLRFSEDMISHLRSWGIFSESFLTFLKGIVLPPVEIRKSSDSSMYYIEVDGPWVNVTLWETIVLAIVNELYARSQIGITEDEQRKYFNEGNKRLSDKISVLKKNPQIKYAQFGKRRRASRLWEYHVTRRLVDEARGNIIGVSNVALARDVGLEATGTNAHELQMAMFALARHSSDIAARETPYLLLRQWQQLFGNRFLIALTDTFGTPAFLERMTHEQAIDWKGFRQDSGDPVEFGERIISFYNKFEIDPREKIIIFSDGLDLDKIIRLSGIFNRRIQVGFGWGTNLTNDVGIQALSIVMKLIEAAGNPAIKLSDNIAKAIGDPNEIEVAKRIFGYTNKFNEACKY